MSILTLGATAKTARAVFSKDGQPARVEGVPAWRSSDPAILTVSAAADGITALVTPIAPGAAQITLTADAGAKSISATLEVNVQLPLADAAAIVLE